MKILISRLKFLFWYNRGILRNKSGNYEGAVQDYEKAKELNPNYSELYYCCGIAKYDQGDKEGSIIEYDKAIELNPNHAQAYYNRGLSKKRLDFKNAIQDFGKAIELGNFAAAYLHRGLIKHMNGDREGALIDLKKAGDMGISKAYDFINNHIK